MSDVPVNVCLYCTEFTNLSFHISNPWYICSYICEVMSEVLMYICFWTVPSSQICLFTWSSPWQICSEFSTSQLSVFFFFFYPAKIHSCFVTFMFCQNTCEDAERSAQFHTTIHYTTCILYVTMAVFLSVHIWISALRV